MNSIFVDECLIVFSHSCDDTIEIILRTCNYVYVSKLCTIYAILKEIFFLLLLFPWYTVKFLDVGHITILEKN
jgi:hypothetical protein